jgi:glutaredoxin
MEIKVYSQKHCKYCDNIKTALNENNIEFEEVEITEVRDEWNTLTRVVGLALTPTIKFKDEVWVPSRDFRSPEELIKRIEYFQEFPLPVPTEDEKTEMLLNAFKNIGMSLQNINMTLGQMRTKLDQLTTKQTEEEPPIAKEEVTEEETTNN